MAKQGNCKSPDKSPSRAGQPFRTMRNKNNRIKRSLNKTPLQEPYMMPDGHVLEARKTSRYARRHKM